jgi:H/ACA ribonucleoprotein complex subunit 4
LRSIIQPVETGTVHLPKIWVLDSAVDSLSHGANLHLPGISKLNSGIKKGDITAVMTLKDEIVCYGLAMASSEEMMGEKGIAVKVEKVFMEPGTYPKYVKEA